MQTKKPQAEPGSTCPLFRKDVSKVCHGCEMFEPLPLGRLLPSGGVELEQKWGCTLKHQTFVLRDIVSGLAGLQKAQESFRNTAYEESQKNATDMLSAFKHQGDVNSAVMARVCDVVTKVAGAIDAASLNVIEGRDGRGQIEHRMENDQ